MNTRASVEGMALPLAKATMRACSRKRPTMLLTRMFSERPGDAGPQAADAADHQVDGHPGLAGRIEGVDDLRIDQGVHLGPDGGRLASALAFSASRAIRRSRSAFMVIGEKDSFSRRSGCA